LSREEKLDKLRDLASIEAVNWEKIVPSRGGDWLHQKSEEFDKFISISDKKNPDTSIFSIQSGGVKTSCDPWVYNFDSETVQNKMTDMVNFYNSEVERYQEYLSNNNSEDTLAPQNFVDA